MPIRKDIDAPDPYAQRRAEMARLAEAYERSGRGIGPHFYALADGLKDWGHIFDHNGIRYTQMPDRDFARARIQARPRRHEPSSVRLRARGLRKRPASHSPETNPCLQDDLKVPSSDEHP